MNDNIFGQQSNIGKNLLRFKFPVKFIKPSVILQNGYENFNNVIKLTSKSNSTRPTGLMFTC